MRCPPAGATPVTRVATLRFRVRGSPHVPPDARACGLLGAAALLWAGVWTIARALSVDAPPIALAFWRWAVALAVLLPMALVRLRGQAAVLRTSWPLLALLGVLATALQHVPIHIGLQHTTATNGALLYAISPVLILLLARALFGEPIGPRAAAGIAVALAGAVTILSAGSPAALLRLRFNAGDLWVLLGTLSWAGYTVCLRRRPAGLDPVVGLAALALAGVIAMLPLLAWETAIAGPLEPTPATLLGIAYMGVVATVLGYLLWNRGVERIGPARAAPFLYLMTLFAPLLAAAILDEAIRTFHVVGAALIVGGIWFANRR